MIMKYSVNIEVTPHKGQKLNISRSVSISYDAERDLYKSKMINGVWTYGDIPEELAIRLVTDGWRKRCSIE